MQDTVTPKIILNEEFLDLRKYPDNSLSSKRSNSGTTTTHQKDTNSVRTTNLKSEGLRFEKELINCGLKKLVNSYNATANMHPQRQILNKKKCRAKEKSMFDPRFRRFIVPEEKTCLKSQSELSIVPKKIYIDQVCTSTPVFQSKKTTSIELESQKNRYEPHKNKCTMTKNENQKLEGHIIKARRPHTDRTRKYPRLNKGPDAEIMNRSHQVSKQYMPGMKPAQYVDPRLCEKYSVLKMPWKRTWTIPVFSPKSSTMTANKGFDNFDRQTYLYDDGTEIDSVYIEDKQKHMLNKAFQSQCMAILFLGGSLCGIILVSLLIWFIFGNDFFHIFFKIREPQEGVLKHSVKFIGGGIIYLLTTFFKTLGTVLSIPTKARRHKQKLYTGMEESKCTGNVVNFNILIWIVIILIWIVI